MTRLFETVEQLAGFIYRITDNGGSSSDRYTIVFTDGDYLGMSSAPSHPQGVSMWGEGIDVAFQADRVEEGLEVDLALGDLPEHLVEHIWARCNEGFEDFLEIIEAKHAKYVAPDRKAADANDGTSDSFGKGLYLDGDNYRVKLDGAKEDDRGPFASAAEAVRATIPEAYGLAGQEYHSTTDVTRLEPDAAVLAAVEAVEARVNDEDNAPESGL